MMAPTNSLMLPDHNEERAVDTLEDTKQLERLRQKLRRQLERAPLIRKLPPRAIAIIVLLVLVNLIVWAAAGIVLVSTPQLRTLILGQTDLER